MQISLHVDFEWICFDTCVVCHRVVSSAERDRGLDAEQGKSSHERGWISEKSYGEMRVLWRGKCDLKQTMT